MRFEDILYTRLKIRDVCAIVGGCAIDSKDMRSSGKYQIIKMGNLYNGMLDLNRNPSFINEVQQNAKNYILKYGDIVLTLTGTQGKRDYGFSAIISENKNLILNQRCALLRTNLKCYDKYLYYFLKTSLFLNQFFTSSIGGTGNQTNVSIKALNNFNICLPTKNEQIKIGDFLFLIDQRIDTQSKIIEKYESLISTIRTNIFSSLHCKWTKLCDLVENKSLQLNRGNIIPKHQKDDVYKYPVYSSSVQKDGLMGYSDYYMFDKELITWSIDGGGDIFFREKHKFCVTNVCGILQLDTNKFSYKFVAEALKYQHSKMTFDYQTKAHPSVIEKLYALPDIELNEQDKYSKLFEILYSKLGNERKYLEIIKEQKKYLLSNMFI